jgi:predicted acyl esterase
LDRALVSDGPLLECDRLVANGEPVPCFRQVLPNLLALPFFRQCVADAADPFWAGKNELALLEGAGAVAVAAHIVGGWHDFFVEEQLCDWRALRDARAARGEPPPLLTVGPWAHWSVLDFAPVAARAALDHFDRVLRGGAGIGGVLARGAAPEARTSLHSTSVITLAAARRGARGAGDVRGNARARVDHGRGAFRPLRRVAAATRRAQRPVTAAPRRLLEEHGEPGESLDAAAAADGADSADGASRCTYDPHDPTPARGGPSFNPQNCGRREQAPIERRADVLVFSLAPRRAADVLVFSSAPLAAPVVLAGEVRAQLRVRSSCDHTDWVCAVSATWTRRGAPTTSARAWCA